MQKPHTTMSWQTVITEPNYARQPSHIMELVKSYQKAIYTGLGGGGEPQH